MIFSMSFIGILSDMVLSAAEWQLFLSSEEVKDSNTAKKTLYPTVCFENVYAFMIFL